MRGVVPEDKGDKDQVAQMYTYILIGLSIGYEFWFEVEFKISVKAKGYSLLGIYSLSSLHLVEKLHLNNDFKPIN